MSNLQSFSVSTSSIGGAATKAPVIHRPYSRIEHAKWEVLAHVRRFFNVDIDWYRAKYGKAAGETRFFAQHEPDEVLLAPGNMLLGNGASAIWQCLEGNGSASANNALASGPTYFNNAQSALYVGDGDRRLHERDLSANGGDGNRGDVGASVWRHDCRLGELVVSHR
jgi:hypothetical protein